MGTLYFITRSFPDVGSSSGGGALARQAQVEVLKACGLNVKVIVPHPNGPTYEENDIIYIGFRRWKKFYSGLEKLGLIGDSYYPWVKAILKFLEEKASDKDIAMCVTGGSADTFLAGLELKKKFACKLVLSYHDPINYTTFKNMVVDKHYLFKKDFIEKKVVAASDLIFTSSGTFKDALISKYPNARNKVHNYYFGYNLREVVSDKTYRFPLKLAYAGSFNKHQSPEIMYQVAHGLPNYNLIYLGNYNSYPPLIPLINSTEFLGFLSHSDFLKFAREKIDIGFVSLTSNYLAACFPSKIFEYINLGLPILGALPESDAMDFINNNKIGRAFHFRDLQGMREYLNNLTSDELEIQRRNILKLKDRFFYGETLKGMCDQIKNLN